MENEMARGKRVSAKELATTLAESAFERRAIFKELLAHVRAGYSIDCFSRLSEKSIQTYLKDYKEEFVQEDLEDAIRDAKQGWEQIGRRQATGDCLGNSRSWYYNMANRYGWSDKQKIEAEHSGAVAVNIVSYSSAKKHKELIESSEQGDS